MEWLGDLNPEQCEAVQHVEGPLLVLAGAGSGKTRVITRRVAYLIDQGVPPDAVLAITFTNKAAGEMQERIAALVPHGHVWVSTFHKFCARLLRAHGPRIGVEKGYVIYDRADRLRVIKECLEQLEIDKSRLPPARVEHVISRAKNDLVGADDYIKTAHDYVHGEIARVYAAYEKRMRDANAVDFDDLLLDVARLLQQESELRQELDARHRFILVDEYQDTNMAQYAIVRGLSIDYPNLCVTGDPDQSIYGWRGANLNNILHFESDFPGTRVVRLEKNYRSTKSILRAASHLIRFNLRRKPKDLVTDNPEGLPVSVRAYTDERDEAASIAAEIAAAVRTAGAGYGDFAVLCRVAALTRALELALTAERVPYQVLSGVAYFERAEVKDVLAYLRLLVNPRDDLAFRRVVNVPARGIGKSTLERLAAEAAGRPLLEAARSADRVASIRPAQAQALARFVRLADDLAALQGRDIAEIIRQLLERTQYLEGLADTPEADERRANIEELLTAAHQFDLADPGGDLELFLGESTLSSDMDAWDPGEQKVSLMTLHAAKGLEFPAVYIVAVEQGILPHARSLEESADVEEERRLLFVGMTRAKRELHLSFVQRREFRGNDQRAIPSAFLSELPRPQPEPRRVPAVVGKRLVTASELAGAPAVGPGNGGDFREGMLVNHPSFGLGRIAALSGYGADRRATVNFTVGRPRTFVISKSSLEPVRKR